MTLFLCLKNIARDSVALIGEKARERQHPGRPSTEIPDSPMHHFESFAPPTCRDAWAEQQMLVAPVDAGLPKSMKYHVAKWICNVDSQKSVLINPKAEIWTEIRPNFVGASRRGAAAKCAVQCASCIVESRLLRSTPRLKLRLTQPAPHWPHFTLCKVRRQLHRAQLAVCPGFFALLQNRFLFVNNW